MNDWLFALVTDWGATALAVATFLSCLALPVPASLMLLVAGAMAASGDLDIAPLASAAFAGVFVGDQTGFQLGRVGLTAIEGWLMRNATRAAIITRARELMQNQGSIAVFLSRWLFSPLGPYVIFLAGGARMPWATFTAMSVAGEIIWVSGYLGIGYAAGGKLSQVADLLGNMTGLATSLLITVGLGVMLWRRRKGHH